MAEAMGSLCKYLISSQGKDKPKKDEVGGEGGYPGSE